MKIIYMHHAQKDNYGEENQKLGNVWRNQENNLTEIGIKEIKMFVENFKGKMTFSAIYVGEFKRYKLTADIVNIDNAPIFVDKRLNESGSDEEFVGIVVNNENRKSIYAKHMKVLRQRTHKFLDEIISKHNNDENILCISSGVNLGEFMSYFYNGNGIECLEIAYAVGLCPIVFQYYKTDKK